MIRVGAAAASAVVMLLSAAAVRAQMIEERDKARFRSPQSWAVELKMGPYYPDIDSEFSGKTPHQRYFGKSHRLMGLVEVDYQFFRGFGSAAVALALGFSRETAHAFVESGGDVTATRSGDETQLTLYPTAVSFVYRLDEAARRWRLPIVPYAKLGLSYTFWSISDGNGNVATSTSGSGRGKGGTAGWCGAIGAALLLDILDPGAARELDSEVGVNHTYFFLEASRFDQSGLGKKNVLNVGDTTWFAGFMFEF